MRTGIQPALFKIIIIVIMIIIIIVFLKNIIVSGFNWAEPSAESIFLTYSNDFINKLMLVYINVARLSRIPI
jgi:hypothetical protein